MNAREAEGPDDLTAYLDLNGKEVSKIIMWLLIEESLRGRLSAFRHDLPTQPIQSLEKLSVVGDDIMLVSNGLRRVG